MHAIKKSTFVSTDHSDDTLIQSFNKIRRFILEQYTENCSKWDEITERLNDVERQIALATPTCLHDALIQLETFNAKYSDSNSYDANEPLNLENDCCAVELQMVRTVICYLKSLQSTQESKILSLAVNNNRPAQAGDRDNYLFECWEILQKVEKEFNSFKGDEETYQHKSLEDAYFKAWHNFHDIKPVTLKGLLLKVRDRAKSYNEMHEFQEIEESLTDIIRSSNVVAESDPVIKYAKEFDAADKGFQEVDIPGAPKDAFQPFCDRMNKAEKALESTVAHSTAGVMAQVKSLARFVDGFLDQHNERVANCLSVIKEGLQNLQSQTF